jgi:hypothetical protein
VNRFDVAEHAASEEDYKEQKRNLLSCVETYTCAAEEASKGVKEKNARETEKANAAAFTLRSKGRGR